ncbi:hypothetical protein AAG570_006925 [Ranatra chinensis]|uniref:Ig-like domain-containing protein n=1 Tax=Ranatra chinensis TaxID=642074 RepID=A0ABD0ZCD9_9HEMI
MMIPVLFLLGLVHAWACPSSCVCKWKGGKQTVECINKSLITIPQGMDQGTQVLDFAGNNLNRLLKERFQKMGLINLQKIFMSRCRIKHIEDRAFKGLTNLVELDLSDNSISTVPTETFYDYPSLMRLFLSGNPIKYIKPSSFQPLSFLTNLELSHCDLENVEDGAFVGLNSLEWLKLDNNKLTSIKGSKILPDNLHGIDLHHNPWSCDCRLLDVRAWLVTYNVPHTIEPTCSTPLRLKGTLIRNVAVNDLACLPDINPTTLYLEIAEGKNVSLLCRVSAIPEAKVSWWFQGTILQNDSIIAPGLHLYYYVEEGSFEKTSELFIFNTNAEDNGTFVCVAENQAGRTHSNYTIRIILKEEPIMGLAVFPYEYVVTVSAAVSVIAVVVVICIALCLVQCRRQRRRRRKKDRSKVAALQAQQRADKVPVPRAPESEAAITRLGPVQSSGAQRAQEMMVYSTGAGVLSVPGPLPFPKPPPPLGVSFQEQNPDLINDTGSKEWRQEGGADEKEAWASSTLPRDLFPKHLTADVHLSPGKFIGPDGYPIDFGLPKLAHHYPVAPPLVLPPAPFYRTLPHKPRNSAANPAARFCREAEFLTYEQYGDVRYTAEGYPCFPCDVSPPAPYRSGVAAQTTEQGKQQERSQQAPQQQQQQQPLPQQQPLSAESPDEGYEGDPTDI